MQMPDRDCIHGVKYMIDKNENVEMKLAVNFKLLRHNSALLIQHFYHAANN